MDDKLIHKVSRIIEEWNPLGNQAASIKDLNGYRTEAIDILSTYEVIYNGNITKAVIDILEQAFDIEIDSKKAEEVASRIEMLFKK